MCGRSDSLCNSYINFEGHKEVITKGGWGEIYIGGRS